MLTAMLFQAGCAYVLILPLAAAYICASGSMVHPMHASFLYIYMQGETFQQKY